MTSAAVAAAACRIRAAHTAYELNDLAAELARAALEPADRDLLQLTFARRCAERFPSCRSRGAFHA